MSTEQEKKKRVNLSLNLLRLLAILLIINSHSDIFYPGSIRFLASGGAIGNGLFFALSGYFFHIKGNKKNALLNRFFKLFVPVWIMTGLSLVFKEIKITDAVDAVRLLIWPTRFWFVGAVFLYYVLLTIIPKRYSVDQKKNFVFLMGLLVVLDLAVWFCLIPEKTTWIVEDARLFRIVPFKVIYCFMEFAAGYYIGRNKKSCSVWIAALLSVATFGGFYGFKFLLNKGVVPMELQILSQPLTVVCVISILLTFIGIDLNKSLEDKKVGNAINFLSGLSLETYVVQFLIIAGVHSMNLKFPVNVMLSTVFIFIAAWILNMIDRVIHNKICKSLKLT